MARPKADSSASAGRIVVENINVPGYTQTVDAAMYTEMKRALLATLPTKPPGMTQSEIRRTVVGRLSASLFPRGAKSEWWSKLVQLDLEAKGVVRREDGKPLRWHKVKQ